MPTIVASQAKRVGSTQDGLTIATPSGGGTEDSPMVAGFKGRNSARARGIGFAEEQSPTINADGTDANVLISKQPADFSGGGV